MNWQLPLSILSCFRVLVELVKSIPVHSLTLSSHLFFCLHLFLFPFTVPCRIVFAKPEDIETWPNHLSFRFLTRVRSSSYSPKAALIFLRTSSLVIWSFYEMFNKPSVTSHLKSRKENPQKPTQLSSRSHQRHLVGKRTAQKTPS